MAIEGDYDILVGHDVIAGFFNDCRLPARAPCIHTPPNTTHQSFIPQCHYTHTLLPWRKLVLHEPCQRIYSNGTSTHLPHGTLKKRPGPHERGVGGYAPTPALEPTRAHGLSSSAEALLMHNPHIPPSARRCLHTWLRPEQHHYSDKLLGDGGLRSRGMVSEAGEEHIHLCGHHCKDRRSCEEDIS